MRLWRDSGIGELHRGIVHFDQLGVAPDHVAAVEVLRQFVDSGRGILFVLGPRGTGKTQAASVCVTAFCRVGLFAKYVTSIGLMADLKAQFDQKGSGGEKGWRERWEQPSLLVVDEIGEMQKTPYSDAHFADLMDARYRAGRVTLLVGNVQKNGVGTVVGDAVADRANEGGGVLMFDGWPSFRSQ